MKTRLLRSSLLALALLGLTLLPGSPSGVYADTPVFDIKVYRNEAFNYAEKLFDREYARLLKEHVDAIAEIPLGPNKDAEYFKLKNKLNADTAELRTTVDKARKARMLKLEKYRVRELRALEKSASKKLGKTFKVDMTGTPPRTLSKIDGKTIASGPGLESDIDTRTYKVREIDALEEAAVKRYGRKNVIRRKGSIHIKNLDMTSFNKVPKGTFSATVRNDPEYMKNIKRIEEAKLRGKSLANKRIGSGYVADNLKKTHGYLKVKPEALLAPDNPYPLRDIAKATQRNMEAMGIEMPTKEAALLRQESAIQLSRETGKPLKIDFKDQIVLVNKGKLSADAVNIVPPSGSRQEQLDAMAKFQQELIRVQKRSYRASKVADTQWERRFIKRHQAAISKGNSALAARSKRQLILKNADGIRDKIAILKNSGSTTLADMEGLKKVKMRGSGKEMWFDTTQNRYYHKGELKQRILQKEFKDLKRLQRKDLSGMLANKEASRVSLVARGKAVKPRVMTGREWLKSRIKVRAAYSRTLGAVGFLATLPEAYKQAKKETLDSITEDDSAASAYGKMFYTLGKYASGVGFIQKQWSEERQASMDKHAYTYRYGSPEDRSQVFRDAFVDATGKVLWETGKGMVTMPVTMLKNIGGAEREGKALIGDILNEWDARSTAKETSEKLLKYKQETSWRALKTKQSFDRYQKSIKVTRVDATNENKDASDEEASLDTDDALNLAYGRELNKQLQQAQRDYGSAAQRFNNGDKSAHIKMTRSLKRIKTTDARLNDFLDDPDTVRKSEMSKRQAAQLKRRSDKLAATLKRLKARDAGPRTSAVCTRMHDSVAQMDAMQRRIDATNEQAGAAFDKLDNEIARLRQQGKDSSALEDQRATLSDAYDNGDYRDAGNGGESMNTLSQKMQQLQQQHSLYSAACYQDNPADWPALPDKVQNACNHMQDAIQTINRLERQIGDTYRHGKNLIERNRQEIVDEQQRLQEDNQRRTRQRAEIAKTRETLTKASDIAAHDKQMASLDQSIASGDWGGISVYDATANTRKATIAEKQRYIKRISEQLSNGEYQVAEYGGWGPRINAMRSEQTQTTKFMLEQKALCDQ